MSLVTPATKPSTRRRWLAGWSLLCLLAACGGGLSHRSVAEMSGSLPLGQDIRRVRVEIDSGTVGVDIQAERSLQFAGGVRRAADSAADLALVAAQPIELRGEMDPLRPDTLVVRGAQVPAAVAKGVLSYELGLRLPADLELEIEVAGNGHVTVARRAAPLQVRTGRGDLRFEHCTGGIKAVTARGVVIGFGLGGDLDIETAVGDMQVFVATPAGLVRLRTGQGTIQCFLPAATGFRCNARTEMGKLGNGFGLSNEPTTRYGRAMTGQHGDGRTEVILMTGSGYISLQPQG